ncbi:MAG: hypothetical protein COV76_04715 [Candidatus Omnitrophica bacterium CG11_big_fil_rev_8_21_14_0_20_64_10]|nr:MAG: hypothetical protein COV76_04715 [Candidatus Omnitrophica bacterium CG11_big_fil_rev_8_21_14_0_20_64_10]
MRRGVRTKLRALTEGRPSRLTPEMIDAACRLGDPYARQVWAGAGERVGWALAGVVNLLDPERIVVGGGIAKAGRWILEPMRRTVRQRAIRSLRDVKILPAKLGESAGLIGAGLLARGVGA